MRKNEIKFAGIEEFATEMAEAMKKIVPQYSIKVEKVKKANLGTLTALSFREGNVSLLYYLEEDYEDLVAGKKLMSEIVADIMEVLKNPKPDVKTEDIMSWDKAEKKIQLRVMNWEANQEFLENAIYKKVLDLAVVPYILLDFDHEGTTTAPKIQKEHLEIWGVDEETVFAAGKDNFDPIKPLSLLEMMRMLILEEGGNPDICLPVEDENESFMVLTNKSRMYGAFAMFDKTLLDAVAEIVHDNLYIFPSSIHEVILGPVSQIDLQTCEDMVREINQTEVNDYDWLSDTVYFYDAEKKEVTFAR